MNLSPCIRKVEFQLYSPYFFGFFVVHALTDLKDIQYNVLFVYIQNVCVAPLCDQKGNTSKATLRTNTFQTEECTLFIHLSHAGNLQKASSQLSKHRHTQINILGTSAHLFHRTKDLILDFRTHKMRHFCFIISLPLNVLYISLSQPGDRLLMASVWVVEGQFRIASTVSDQVPVCFVLACSA